MKLTKFTKVCMMQAAIILCFAIASPSTSYAQSILKARIASSSDDAEEKPTGTAGDLTSSDLELVMDKTSNQTIGLRFTNIKLPKGALITKAYIQFAVDEPTNIDPCNLVIKVENADNPVTYTGDVGTISTRSMSMASVDWNPTTAWMIDGEAGVNQQTPDLKVLVQSLVDRAGWVKGNAMAFVITGTGARVAQAYDRDPSKAAELVVEYFVPVTKQFLIKSISDDAEESSAGGVGDLTSSDLEFVMDKSLNQTIGLRFADIDLPMGTTISNAYIQFAVDEATNIDPCNLVIQAEDTDNAATFTTSVGTITTRVKSTASVNWNPTAAWTIDGEAGVNQQTPEIKTLVQGVLDRAGWVSGNAMAIFISGTGARVAQAYDRNPSKAAILVVQYMGLDNGVQPKAEVGTFPINRNSQWKYNDQGENLDAELWNARVYKKDTTWEFGNGKLGYGLTALGTTVGFGTDANAKHPTTYLRRTFVTTDASQYDSLIAYTLADDGIVMYINGIEVLRRNVASPSTYSTLATNDVTGTNELKYVRNVILNTLISNDTNTVAIEIHQSALNSTDIVFDMELIGKKPYPATTAFPISKGSNWLYNDQGLDLGTTWKDVNYADTLSWASGYGSLGYTDPTTTVISFGDDNNNKYITSYFRKTFTISNLASVKNTLQLNIMKDDGAVVYINGVEVQRTNMPVGVVSALTLALSSATEGVYETYSIPKSVLVQGRNIIAVEVHQESINSSDLVFDLELKSAPDAPTIARGCADPNDMHISCFTSVAPSSKGQSIEIPTTHAMQALVQAGTPYTVGSGIVKTNFDFTGFVPENMTSSTKGVIALNHETTPGGVSMFDVTLNPTTQLWQVDASRAIDFSGVAGTQRNCSGGITPWGTAITAEESRGTTDLNSDGYMDMGWLVEIDPNTYQIAEYETGTPQKIWAAGNGSHENVAAASDSLTLYWGEDTGDGSVFKFVANNKMDMSSGTLYALKLGAQMVNNEPVVSTGVWTQVPNTTASDRNTSYALAKALGSTLFNGVEDIEIGTVDNKIYFTAKGNSRVYRFKDNGTTVSEFETFIGGASYSFITGTSTVTTEAWGTGNDNLTFDDRGNLYVLQDGSQDHIWMVRPDHTQENPKVELFATTPAGSEPTGMTFSPDYKYMFISMQEPSSSNTLPKTDATGTAVVFNKSTLLVISRTENLGNPISTDIQNGASNSAVVLYPNPTTGDVNVQFNLVQTGNVKIDVVDVTGNVLLTPVDKQYASGTNTIAFQLYDAGIYFVKVSTDAGVQTHKVIVK